MRAMLARIVGMLGEKTTLITGAIRAQEALPGEFSFRAFRNGKLSLDQAESVADLIAYAKANPGRLTYGSAGAGSTIHLAGEFFKRTAAVELVHVPYKGAAPAITDLVGGQIRMMFAPCTRT